MLLAGRPAQSHRGPDHVTGAFRRSGSAVLVYSPSGCSKPPRTRPLPFREQSGFAINMGQQLSPFHDLDVFQLRVDKLSATVTRLSARIHYKVTTLVIYILSHSSEHARSFTASEDSVDVK